MKFSESLEKVLGFIEANKQAAINRSGEFAKITNYCMFIGYPRSGHSLIGSLLDAHPNMAIAHEADALRCLSAGFDRNMIFHTLLENSHEFTQAGRQWNGYAYNVPNQWHGRYQNLQVIGDKKGGRSSIQLAQNPLLLDRLQATIKLPMKFVHVIRNPYDNITTFSKKHHLQIEVAINAYFAMVQSVMQVKRKVGDGEVFDVWQEEFIAQPQVILKNLCEFLGQEPTPNYLEDCASIVFKQPKQSRHEFTWTPELIDLVAQRMEKIPFLQRYGFAS